MTLSEWIAAIRRAEDGSWIARALVRAALIGEREAKTAATTRLRVRSGILRNSIGSAVRRVEGGAELVLTASTRYARIQEEGGTVRPRRGRYLAIPLRGQEGADRAGAFVLTAKSGKKFLARRTEGGGLVLLAILRESVQLRGRRYLRAGLDAAAAELPGVLRAGIEEAL